MTAISATEHRRAIGILGGTFDPVHYGHLRMALEMREALQLAEIRLLPCGEPVHRDPPEADSADRLAMLELAIGDEMGLVIDTREIQRAGPSFMVDTLASLRAELGDTQSLCLLLGNDAFLGLPAWHRWQELLSFAHLVVMSRPGWQLRNHIPVELQEVLEKHAIRTSDGLHARPGGCIWLQEVTALAISATGIRERIAGGLSPRFLLPDRVWDYVRKKKLYGQQDNGLFIQR